MTHRAPLPLPGTDTILRRSFWIGLYPGLGQAELEHASGCLRQWLTGEGKA